MEDFMGGKPLVDRLGHQYGDLTVIKRAESYRGNARWTCECSCGRLATYLGNDLRQGKVKSCGCKNPMHITRHGMAGTPTYKVWQAMKDRCGNPKNARYIDYGARGIRVCERWLDFANFLADMGAKPDGKSLDRTNNDKGYEPGNCTWATNSQQLNNRRNNRFVELHGKRQTLTQWANEKGIKWYTMRERMRRGWTIERALTEPVRKNPRKPKH
jgi:hypothetical protein